jgi:hypothetical protein
MYRGIKFTPLLQLKRNSMQCLILLTVQSFNIKLSAHMFWFVKYHALLLDIFFSFLFINQQTG